jgi:hypothetical protein
LLDDIAVTLAANTKQIAYCDRNTGNHENRLNHPTARESERVAAIRIRLSDGEKVHQYDRCQKPEKRPGTPKPPRNHEPEKKIRQRRKREHKVGCEIDIRSDTAAIRWKQKRERGLTKRRYQERADESREHDEQIATRCDHVV